MAMSQDRGTSKQAVNQGYGLVCDTAGAPYADLIVADANQEHGIITVRPGSGSQAQQRQDAALPLSTSRKACSTTCTSPRRKPR